jgi:hypothetical protein
MKHLQITILLISISFLLYSCPAHEDGHEYITIKNNSNRRLAFQTRNFKVGEINNEYDCKFLINGGVESNSSIEFFQGKMTWEDELGTSTYLQIMLVDRDSLLKYPTSQCDTFKKYAPVLHAYRLTVEELNQRNWTVVYPN